MAKLWILVAAMLGVWWLPSWDTMVVHENLAHDVTRLAAMNDDLSVHILQLNREIHALKRNLDYLEHVTRDELGYVRDDEVLLVMDEKPP